MKKAFIVIEVLITIILILMLSAILIRIFIDLQNDKKDQIEIVQQVIDRSEKGRYDSAVTLDNGMQLQMVSQNGYFIEYLK